MHKEADEVNPSDLEANAPQRRPIACTICAKAKTKCDKAVSVALYDMCPGQNLHVRLQIPSCSRCTAKGLVCESRSTRRSTDAVYRQAKKQLNSYKRASMEGSVTGSDANSTAPSSPRRSPEDQRSEASMDLDRPQHTPTTSSSYPDGQQYLSSSAPFPDTQSYNGFADPSVLSTSYTDSPPFTMISPVSSYPSASDLSVGSLDPTMTLDMNNGVDMLNNTSGVDFFGNDMGQRTAMPNTSMDQYFPMVSHTSDSSLDSHFPTSDSMQLPMDFGYNDMSNVVPPDSSLQMFPPFDTNLHAPPAIPDLTPPISRPTSSENASIGLTMQFANAKLTSSPKEMRPPTSYPSAPVTAGALQDNTAILAVQDGWPVFRCNPLNEASVPPKTASAYLDGLESILKNASGWNAPPSPSINSFAGRINIEGIDNSVREKLTYMTQNILLKARDAQGSSVSSTPRSRHSSRTSLSDENNFISLPTTSTLEHFVRSYTYRFEPYYPMIPAAHFSSSELMSASNQKASSVLLLLMIAQGTVGIPTTEARYMSSGLTEACRIALLDMIETEPAIARDPMVLRAIHLFTNIASWSGDKWHMDFATGQPGMYLQMLRHGSLLEYRQLDLPKVASPATAEVAWKRWQEFESMNRYGLVFHFLTISANNPYSLVYSWVTTDQEISLFNDAPPNLSITELTAALPDNEGMWNAKSAREWGAAMVASRGNNDTSALKAPPSLYELFRRFMNRELTDEMLTPLQLRLLLHPVQALVCHLHECLSCFAGGTAHRQGQRLLTQLEEVQSLLKHWYGICRRSICDVTKFDPVIGATAVIYHLINLNTMTNFLDIEKFARGDISKEQFLQTDWAKVRSAEDSSQIWFHCGQIFRLYRMMPEANRPPWWAASIYRVALIMWATSIAINSNGSTMTNNSAAPHADTHFTVDNVPPEHNNIIRYLRYKEGIPMLSKRNGTLVGLDEPNNILAHCLDVLHEDESTMRLTEGIKSRLAQLVQRVQR